MKIIKFSVVILISHLTYGCASSSGDISSTQQGTRTSSAQAANLKCNAGEILVCKSRESHRVSDGRYGRKNKRNQKCSCQPEADLSGMGMDVIGGNSN